MSKRNKTYAQLAAGMLSDEARDGLMVAAGYMESGSISEEALNELINLTIGRKTKNLLGGSDVFVLSDFGKQVAKFAHEARESQP